MVLEKQMQKLSSWDLWDRKDEGLTFHFKVQFNKSNFQVNSLIPNTRQSSYVIFKSGSTGSESCESFVQSEKSPRSGDFTKITKLYT